MEWYLTYTSWGTIPRTGLPSDQRAALLNDIVGLPFAFATIRVLGRADRHLTLEEAAYE
jgi:hypothetical protein